MRVLIDAANGQNLALHRAIHDAFAAGAEWAGVDGFVEWIYAELFEMPLGDAALRPRRTGPVSGRGGGVSPRPGEARSPGHQRLSALAGG